LIPRGNSLAPDRSAARVASAAIAAATLLLVGVSFAQQGAAPEDAGARDAMTRGGEALTRGAVREAIEAFEAAADRGVLHPDVSYDRGMAYVARAKEAGGQPGDLGQAAAAFEESLWLRSDDEGAAAALEAVRAEVARRRARGDQAMEVVVKPSALRAILGLAPERAWGVLALLASLALGVGLALRRLTQHTLRLAGGIATALGLIASLLFVPMSALARSIRRSTATGVIVATDAAVVDEKGVSISQQQPVPEAARVEISERRGALYRFSWGQVEGYTAASNVRIIRPAQAGLP
jgi:hypothetical protein